MNAIMLPAACTSGLISTVRSPYTSSQSHTSVVLRRNFPTSSRSLHSLRFSDRDHVTVRCVADHTNSLPNILESETAVIEAFSESYLLVVKVRESEPDVLLLMSQDLILYVIRRPSDGFTVSDFMTRKADLLVVQTSTTVDKALEILVEKRITGFPVVDADWNLVGVVSDYDLLALDSISGGSHSDAALFPDVDSTWKVGLITRGDVVRAALKIKHAMKKMQLSQE
ncbi:CBS domain-containing protein CBSX1, chloroplastic-like protein [Tanacetum coccineum]